MRKTTSFVVAPALIVIGPPPIGQGIEPLQLMVNAKDLSRAEFVDYTFVFH